MAHHPFFRCSSQLRDIDALWLEQWKKPDKFDSTKANFVFKVNIDDSACKLLQNQGRILEGTEGRKNVWDEVEDDSDETRWDKMEMGCQSAKVIFINKGCYLKSDKCGQKLVASQVRR